MVGPIDKFTGNAYKSNHYKPKFDPETFKRLLITWITKQNISFQQVENIEFRKLQHYCDPSAAALIPKSGNTIKAWIYVLFNQAKDHLRSMLHRAPGVIHITLDMWSSTNQLPLLGVIAHFSDEDGFLQQVLLGLRTIEGGHTGENMAEAVLIVVNEYGIEDRLGYFMMDNASANDTLVSEIAYALAEKGIEFDSDMHRLRCIAHTINLSVKDFLFGTDSKVSLAHYQSLIYLYSSVLSTGV
jgi:hypothetical protein